MGNFSTASEKGTLQPEKANGKELTILGEFCDMWGYANTVSQFKTIFLNKLTQMGYVVNFAITSLPGGNGEYFVYNVINNEKKIIFSNDKTQHANEGPVFGGKITNRNVDDVVNKIEEMNK